MEMYFSLIVTFLLILGIIVASIQNNISLDLKYFAWKFQLSLAALMFYSALIGAAIVGIHTLPKLASKYLKIRGLKKEIDRLKRNDLVQEKLPEEDPVE